jgi:hypothetical protein
VTDLQAGRDGLVARIAEGVALGRDESPHGDLL